jgi:hypothetical protein
MILYSNVEFSQDYAAYKLAITICSNGAGTAWLRLSQPAPSP